MQIIREIIEKKGQNVEFKKLVKITILPRKGIIINPQLIVDKNLRKIMPTDGVICTTYTRVD